MTVSGLLKIKTDCFNKINQLSTQCWAGLKQLASKVSNAAIKCLQTLFPWFFTKPKSLSLTKSVSVVSTQKAGSPKPEPASLSSLPLKYCAIQLMGSDLNDLSDEERKEILIPEKRAYLLKSCSNHESFCDLFHLVYALVSSAKKMDPIYLSVRSDEELSGIANRLGVQPAQFLRIWTDKATDAEIFSDPDATSDVKRDYRCLLLKKALESSPQPLAKQFLQFVNEKQSFSSIHSILDHYYDKPEILEKQAAIQLKGNCSSPRANQVFHLNQVFANKIPSIRSDSLEKRTEKFSELRLKALKLLREELETQVFQLLAKIQNNYEKTRQEVLEKADLEKILRGTEDFYLDTYTGRQKAIDIFLNFYGDQGNIVFDMLVPNIVNRFYEVKANPDEVEKSVNLNIPKWWIPD